MSMFRPLNKLSAFQVTSVLGVGAILKMKILPSAPAYGLRCSAFKQPLKILASVFLLPVPSASPQAQQVSPQAQTQTPWQAVLIIHSIMESWIPSFCFS